MDPYYNRYEISNSDLNELWKYFHGPEYESEPAEAYKFGNLIDCMITEPEKINYLNYTCNGEQYTKDQFDKAYKMLVAVRKDSFANYLISQSVGQKVIARSIEMKYGEFPFTVNCRCKYDLFSDKLGWGGDIKSTSATTQQQFIDACWHFGYHRQRAFYMDLSGAPKDIIIGISKINFQVFKFPIDRSSTFYKAGKEQYTDLAFKWWVLFYNFNQAA